MNPTETRSTISKTEIMTEKVRNIQEFPVQAPQQPKNAVIKTENPTTNNAIVAVSGPFSITSSYLFNDKKLEKPEYISNVPKMAKTRVKENSR